MQSHYIAITDLDKLLLSEVNSDSHRRHHSSNCLRTFYSEPSRDEHHAQCTGDPDPFIVMPHPDGHNNILKFEHIGQQLCYPRVLYMDMETIQPQEFTPVSLTQTDIATHVPCGYCCYTYDNHSSSTTSLYRGPDCIARLREILNSLRSKYPLTPSPQSATFASYPSMIHQIKLEIMIITQVSTKDWLIAAVITHIIVHNSYQLSIII